MKDEGKFREDFAWALAEKGRRGRAGTPFAGRHRIARMKRFAAKHGSAELLKRMARMEERVKAGKAKHRRQKKGWAA